jgi:hypothetical protein
MECADTPAARFTNGDLEAASSGSDCRAQFGRIVLAIDTVLDKKPVQTE